MKLKRLHYSWIIAITSTAILFIQVVPWNSFGIFLLPLTEQFGWGRGALSGASSVSFVLMGILGIFTGKLSDRYGPRVLVTLAGLLFGAGFLLMSRIDSLWQVYLVWGFFMGVAGSCCFNPIVSTIPRWFEEKRGMALGITAAGMGIGGVLFPLLVQWFISSGSWSRAFWVLSLVALLIIPLAQFLRQSPERMGLKAYGEKVMVQNGKPEAAGESVSWKQVVRSGRFWLFVPLHVSFIFINQVILVHSVPYAVDVGILPIVAASILSIVSASSIIGNLTMGFISDKIGGRLGFGVCIVMVMLALIWLLFAGEAWMFYLFAVVFGLAWGGTAPLVTLVSVELFGLKSLGVILGSVMLIGTITGSLGSITAGVIFDATGSYSVAFVICIAICLLAITFNAVLLRLKD